MILEKGIIKNNVELTIGSYFKIQETLHCMILKKLNL